MCIDELRFEAAKNRVIGINRERQGIGTLSEKTVHAVLKNYYAPDTDMHEIPIENFVADIFTGTEIISKKLSGDDRLSDPSYQMAFLDRRGERGNVTKAKVAEKR